MALGFIIGLFITIKLAKQRNINKETIIDYFIYLIPSSIIGARILAIILNPQNYQTFYDMIAVWNGGVAIHGGIIGGTIATYFFTKKRNLHFYDIADIIVIPLGLGLALGRLGNFINQEFVGKPTYSPWGVNFNNYPEKRHPSQIYESIKNLIIFAITLKLYTFKRLKKGTIMWMFLLLYSLLRFGVEFFKDTTTYFGLTYGQLISIPITFLSIIMLYRIART